MTFKEKVKKFIPRFILSIYHFCWALLGAVVFACLPAGRVFQKNKFKIIGITGTSGKTTTTHLTTAILQEAGYKVASISSVRFKIGEKEWENKYKMSMPGRFVIQKFLWQACLPAGRQKKPCDFVVLEVTSEGIRQFRHRFIDFDTVVFTNLSPEHIESHGGFENYKKEKLKLFKAAKNIHVINGDDKNAEDFLKIPAKQKIVFGINDAKNLNLKLQLVGDFNVMNALAAMNVAMAYGVSLETCKKTLEKAKSISGRMEVVTVPPQRDPARGGKSPIKVVVDYAHTPEQLESVYKTFKEEPLICVLGSCGGGRDKWKRPVLGQLAKKYCKEIILTNEDPYDEDPLYIIKEIENALLNDGVVKHQIILDRGRAIEKAVALAKPGDCVIITGKGSEPWMCVANNKKIPWSDKEIVKEMLKKSYPSIKNSPS